MNVREKDANERVSRLNEFSPIQDPVKSDQIIIVA